VLASVSTQQADVPRILHMKTTSLADVRSQLSKYVEDVVTTHERVTITRNGRPAAVLISAEDLEALEETLFWAHQGSVDEDGTTVGLDVVVSDVRSRQDRD
jgi:antitoxin YefM